MGDIYIHTNDDHQVKISTTLFNDSEYLNYMSDLMDQEENEKIVIKTPTIDYHSLNLIIMAHQSPDTFFSRHNIPDIIKVLNTSNFLNINDLFLKTVDKIRDIIRESQDTNTLRQLLAEKNDFSHGEYQAIKQKDSWCKLRYCHDTQGFVSKLQAYT